VKRVQEDLLQNSKGNQLLDLGLEIDGSLERDYG